MIHDIDVSWLTRLLWVVRSQLFLLLVLGIGAVGTIPADLYEHGGGSALLGILVAAPLAWAAYLSWRNLTVISVTIEREIVFCWIVIGSLLLAYTVVSSAPPETRVASALLFVSTVAGLICLHLVKRIDISYFKFSLVQMARGIYGVDGRHYRQWRLAKSPVGGVAMIVSGLVVINVGDIWPWEHFFPNTTKIQAAMQNGLIFSSGIGLIFAARAYFQPTAEKLLLADKRAPIVLLRSFTDDQKYSRLKQNASANVDTSLESRLAGLFAFSGPFIAVGSPNDKNPILGASRASLSDDEWRGRVLDWLRRSQLIVLIPGTTFWVDWELRQIIERGYHRKVMLLMPELRNPFRRGANLKRRLDSLVAAFRDTPWKRAFASLKKVKQIRCILLADNGELIVIRSRSRSRDSFHLGAMIGQYFTNLRTDDFKTSFMRRLPGPVRSFPVGTLASLALLALGALGPFHDDPPAKTAQPRYAVVKSIELNVRDGPAASSRSITTIARGKRVAILFELENGWDEILSVDAAGNTTRGYVNRSYLAASE